MRQNQAAEICSKEKKGRCEDDGKGTENAKIGYELVRSRNNKLRIVLKFLIFDQVVPPQLWSHDVTTIQVHNVNIYSFIVESFNRFCPAVLEFGCGIETQLKN